MTKYLVSIDQSLRSSGVCIFKDDLLLDFKIIKSSKDDHLYEEKIFMNIWNELDTFIYSKINKDPDYSLNIVIEGLSLNSRSSSKDKIYGLHWFLRTLLYNKYICPIGVIPVKSWRNWYTTKETRKKAKETYSNNYLKWVVVDTIPKYVRKRFSKYLENQKMKKESIFDLCDSYAIGLYRISLKEYKSVLPNNTKSITK